MNKSIKIGDVEFDVEIPGLDDLDKEKNNDTCRAMFQDKSVMKALMEWHNMICNQNEPPCIGEEWVTLPGIPQFRFKNLKLHHVSGHHIKGNEMKSNDAIEHTMFFTYDRVEHI